MSLKLEKSGRNDTTISNNINIINDENKQTIRQRVITVPSFSKKIILKREYFNNKNPFSGSNFKWSSSQACLNNKSILNILYNIIKRYFLIN
jgi:hypothetical protein